MRIRLLVDVEGAGQQALAQPSPPRYSRRFRAGEIVVVTDIRQPPSQRRRHPSSIYLTLPGGVPAYVDLPADSFEILSTYSEGVP